MVDDADTLANSMVRMYGAGAEAIAKGHAVKHGQSGDRENHALWLQVAQIIRERHSAAI